MRGFDRDEQSSKTSNGWNDNLIGPVNELPPQPRGGLKSVLRKSRSDSVFRCEVMPVPIPDLYSEMRDKCTMSPEQVKNNSTKNWRKKFTDMTINPGSSETDEGVELSIDSMSSSSGMKDGKVFFSCESSPETSDLDLNSETQLIETKPTFARKDKESKKSRFKRMITRPLRRSHSAGCTKDIPAHATFLEESGENDTMETRANELANYHERLFGSIETTEQIEQRKLHKTCSADAAMTTRSDVIENSHHKSKSRNQPFKTMKKKFQLLRRRNTDTALVPKFGLPFKFTMPTHEKALQWSKSFDSLLNDQNGLELFKSFLKSEFSEENLEFWIACEEYRSIDEPKMHVLAQKIYGEFIAFQAPKEINLDSNTRMITVSGLENPTAETFRTAQKKIQALMEKDSYSRFIESEIYQQLLENLSKAD